MGVPELDQQSEGLGDTLAKLALGLNEPELTEQGGRIVGKRLGQGVTQADLTGVARYIAKQGATIRLNWSATISGKVYNYDYFGYLIPAWGVAGATQPDTIYGDESCGAIPQILPMRR